MSIGIDLLKTYHIGVRDLREHLSSYFKKEEPIIVTERGMPIKVIFSYKEMLELLDMLDEITDLQTLGLIQEARKAIKKGAKGISVSNLFKKIRSSRKPRPS